MSWVALVGGVLVVVGLIGVGLAPRLVAVQQSRGLAVGDGAADTDDRIQVTKGVGVLLTIVGFVVIVLTV